MADWAMVPSEGYFELLPAMNRLPNLGLWGAPTRLSSRRS